LLPPSIAPRFLTRLQATGLSRGNPRLEQVLAISRLFLASVSLAAEWIYPFSPKQYHDLAVFVLLGYTVHSLGLFIALKMDPEPSPGFIRWSQISDVLWPVLLCLFADPPNSVFYIFFLFALVAAAFRYGLLETMAVALISVGALLLQAAITAFSSSRVHQILLTGVDPSRLLFRSGYLLLCGFLLGVLAETEKELKAEIALVNRLLSMARVGTRLADSVVEVSSVVARVFNGDHVSEFMRQSSTGRMFRWDIHPSTGSLLRVQEILSTDYALTEMDHYPHTFYMRRGKDGRCTIDALDDEGRVLDNRDLHQPKMPIEEANSVLAVSVEMGREWTGRFVVVDAKLSANPERELRFAQNVTRQLAPALYSVYLFRRFRSRVGAIERARVARELHDTAIQSLISIEMQLDVLRRRPADAQLGSELERIQGLLREEVFNLRELMRSMRPIDIGPHQFLDFIAQLVERFRRDTGVSVNFVSELQEVTLPATTCRELARIVQESLVNIRKHSAARSALVRFGAQGGLWKLVVDDDGHGFAFAGRFTLTELDELRRGPTVIKERVRAIGGDMVIESTPGHGSRLEITIPQKGYDSYGK
jgi:signal transduction histidine kinase